MIQPQNQAQHLPVSLKIVHGVGAFAYGIKDNGFSVFLLIFYNQVLGLDAGIVGAVIMVALLVDAIMDPIIGELSDRTQSRWGRRLPWLYGAAIPVGIAWLLLWHPPVFGPTGLILWLFGTAVLTRFLISMCEVPSIAIVPELTSDYDERTQFMRYRFLFAWGGGLIILILAYGVFFSGPKGISDPSGYNAFSICGALMITGTVLFSAIGQHSRIAKPSPPIRPAHSLGHALGEMRSTLSNRAFLWLMAAALFALINQGLTFALSNYLLIFLWQLERMEMLYYALILFASVIIAFACVPPISRRLGKKDSGIILAIIALTINTALYACWLLDLVPGGPSNPLPVFMFSFVLCSNSAAIALMILTSSMMADVVEASQAETGRRSEGLFFAGYFFIQKCAVGIGTFVAGMILTFAQFPAKAVPGSVDLGVLDRLARLNMVALFTIGTIGILILRRFPITRQDHDMRVRALNAAT